MRVPRHPGGSHRSAVGLLCEKGPAAASLVQIRCQTVFLRIHPNRSLISPCGSAGPPSRPEPKCLGSWERPAPFFSSLETSSHFRLLTVPKQPTKTLRELGPGPEAENGRKKRSGRTIKENPLTVSNTLKYCSGLIHRLHENVCNVSGMAAGTMMGLILSPRLECSEWCDHSSLQPETPGLK
ncbi:uncharacterized protein LOC104670800 isoform X1 [Rhinopithecus roxellana]|uniref:uncharacterized protein LOC104670800 isoform X1 n=1 Tax=Rhinopithecus roxellana TaxID=61622 RepID=UPI00123753F6|nr:uncharacterized protein LOC104670800 isoform X1 [Rhinopithecus roxellana]